MIRRHLEKPLLRAARQMPVVTLTGPRQSGKTTLVRSAFPNHDYVSLEQPDERLLAREDPREFLERYPGPVILDEVQHVPELLSWIQGIVDEENRNGRFILTGSQNILLLDRVSQSLAGRSAILHLLPFSRSELDRRGPLDFLGTLRNRAGTAGDSLETVLFRGFYPRIHDRSLDPRDWLGAYYQTYVERDVRQVLNVGDLEAFGRFIRLCAGRSGQLLNLSSLASDCGITHTTARRWVSVLETSFLIHILRPHFENFGKRLIKSPKLYLADSGLLCFLLGIREPKEIRTHPLRGPIFETFVVDQVLKSFVHRGEQPPVWFWRDVSGNEIDLLIATATVRRPIEIESAKTVVGEFVEPIRKWRRISGSVSRGVLIHGGTMRGSRSEVLMLPWNEL